jgi:hypothetical protein
MLEMRDMAHNDESLCSIVSRLEAIGAHDVDVRDTAADGKVIWGVQLRDVPVLDEISQLLIACPHIRAIGLSGTLITNCTLEQLSILRYLESLDIGSTCVDDEGLEYLARVETLEFLELSLTRATTQAVERLRKRLPTCEITFANHVYRPGMGRRLP